MNSGVIHLIQLRHQESYKVLSRSLSRAKKIWSDRHPQTIFCKHQLSYAAFYTERLDEAAQLLAECIESGTEISSPKTYLLQYQTNLAELETRMGNSKSAESRFRKVVDAFQSMGLADTSKGIEAKRALGQFYLMRARFDEAKPLLELAAKKLPNNIRAQMNFAVCLLELGEVADAERKIDAVMTQAVKRLKPNSPDLALGYAMQASIESQKGDQKAAETLFQKAYSIRESVNRGQTSGLVFSAFNPAQKAASVLTPS